MSKTVSFNQTKIAKLGSAYTNQFIGTAVIFQTWEGDNKVGTIESFDQFRPVIRFADGTWAYGTQRMNRA